MAGPVITLTWKDDLDPASPIALSSPAPATLEGHRVAVVGDLAGKLYALRLSNGAELTGWPASTDAPIESSPSVSGTTVYVGAGDAADPSTGGYYAFAGSGKELWHRSIPYTPSDPQSRGVEAGIAVGTLQGKRAVVAGSLGQYLLALGARNGAPLSGFPWFGADTIFTTAALANLSGGHGEEIIEGGDSTAGNAFNVAYQSGGHIRVLAATGHAGTASPSGGLVCEYNANQVVQGSPAVGPFLSGATMGIVAGTGTYYQGASDTDRLIAVSSSCKLAWTTKLDGATRASPALVDALGNGQLQVAEGTSSGTAYLLDGTNGKVLWSTKVIGPVIGGITSIDLSGKGVQDLLVPTVVGVEILNGQTGAEIDTLETGVGTQNSPLVTDDPNGTLGITVAGYSAGGDTSAGQAVVEHFEVNGSNGHTATEPGAWPEFHFDPQLTGDAPAPG